MKKTLKLEGLNCAHCANTIEIKLKELPWIEDLNLDFVMGNISLNIKENKKYSLKEMQETVDSIEDGVFLKDLEDKPRNSIKSYNNKNLIKLISALILFIIGLFLHSITPINLIFLFAAYLISGSNVLIRAFKNLLKGRLFDEFFLMSIATIGAFIIGEYAEGVGVMIFFQLGEFFQDLAVGKSKRSIQSLMSLKPEFVRRENGEIVEPESIKPGMIIEIRPGEKIPLDGIVFKGFSNVDTKTITGESIPRIIKKNSEVLSGFVNLTEPIKVEVTKIFRESTVSKILEMVQNEGSRKSHTEDFISRFAKIYTPIVVISALLIAVLSPFFIKEWTYNDSIYKSLIFLVISCPCALVLSIPLGYFGGIGRAGKSGILVKGSSFLDKLTEIDTFVFDKTGTLTKGEFEIIEINNFSCFSKKELLDAAYKIEYKSNHPIAIAITKLCETLPNSEPDRYMEITGRGIKSIYGNNIYIGGNVELLKENGIKIDNSYSENGTVVHVSKNKYYLGNIVLNDTLKPGIKELVSTLKPKNVHMLTGDTNKSGLKIGKEAGITNIKCSLLPLEKAEYIKKLKKDGPVLFAGDGINDAPVLTTADIGVSMGGLGSDIAIEASDIVLMDDDPTKIIDAVKIAKFTKKIIIQNIILALGFKAIIMILGVIGFAGLWLAIFADVGVGLLAVLNSVRTLNYKID